MSRHDQFGTSPASWSRDAAFATFLSHKRASTHTSIPEHDDDADSALSEDTISGQADNLRPQISPQVSRISLRPSFTSERTPLILNLKDSNVDLLPETQEETLNTRAIVKQEWAILIKYTIPICCTHLAQYSLTLSTVIAVGKLGTIELAASSLASMTANLTALSLIHGLVSALDTLCPQAFTSENPKTTSTYALRTQIILLLMLIPQSLIFFNAESILLALKQDPMVARRAGEYLRVLFIGLPGFGVFECGRRWLQSQGLMAPPTIIVFIVAPLNILLTYALVWSDKIGIGFKGAPLASGLSMDLLGALMLLYCYFKAPRTAWGGFSMDIFRHWGDNVRLGLAGLALILSDWASWEICSLAASYLGPISLAAQSVCLVTSGVTYQLAFAASAAASVRIGNLLGANRPARAKISIGVSQVLGLSIGIFLSLLLVLNKNNIAKIFSNSEEVISIVARIMPLVALFQVFDAISGVGGGILRGVGRSPVGAVINLIAYYVIGLPLGLTLCFWKRTQMGLIGIWIGLTVALLFTGLFTNIFIFTIDTEREAKVAQARIRQEIERLKRGSVAVE